MADRTVKLLLSHHLTWLAVITVIGLEAAFFLWFDPSPMMALAALALGFMSVAAWPVMFVRSASFARLLYRVPDELHAAQQDRHRDLLSDFADLEFAQGTTQLQLLREKFENLSEIMKRRLNAGELTYLRYLGMAEQVYLAACDNLHEIAVAVRSISTIDPQHLQARLQDLNAITAETAEGQEESLALQQRSRLYEAQRQRVSRLLAQNETAMTVLDKTAAALAETKTGRGQADMDAAAAIAELERLAKRAGDYGTKY